MTEYKVVKDLLLQLKTPNIPKKHWCDNSGWGMAKVMCILVEKKKKQTLATTNSISITNDEVTTMDNQSWLCCHVYTIQNWKRVRILLTLLCVVDGCGLTT